MLTYRRSFAMPELELLSSRLDLCHSSFRIRIERTHRATIDDRITYPTVGWTGFGERPRLDVVLSGRARVIENGVVRHLGVGDFAIGRALDSLFMRGETDEDDNLVILAIEWNLGSLGTSAPIGLPSGTLHAPELSALRRCVDALDPLPFPGTVTTADRSLGSLVEILARLRAAGLPFDTWRARDLASQAPPPLQRVADVLGEALSQQHSSPKSSDLEGRLGVTRRRMRALIRELGTRYGLIGTEWRTLRDRWRLTTALTAMSHPRARTDDVARAVGYGSPEALCHAFSAAGLPSPGQTRAELARLE